MSVSIELHNRINTLAYHIQMISENLTALEGKLAQLEGRQPRKLNLNLTPPAPPSDLQVRTTD